MSEPLDALIALAAEAVRSADALLIGAGAGIGVDSGLPDFRGDAGFWKAYPPFQGKRFSQLSTPHWFKTDPALAWGFFGHRMNLYRAAVPHAGFQILRQWADRFPSRAFVFTSNVDGQFQKAGFQEEMILECHGSIHNLQCAAPCQSQIWSADGVELDVDPATIRTSSPFPRCPGCGGIARPNILMFGDWDWLTMRYDAQQRRYREWQQRVRGSRIVALEMGAGLAIPTVRMECEEVATTVIRINPREPETGPTGIGIPLGALDALQRIAALVS